MWGTGFWGSSMVSALQCLPGAGATPLLIVREHACQTSNSSSERGGPSISGNNCQLGVCVNFTTTCPFIFPLHGTGTLLVVRSGLTAPTYPLHCALTFATSTSIVIPAAYKHVTLVPRRVVKSGVIAPRHPSPWIITSLVEA